MAPLQKKAVGRTFSSGHYLEELMAELDRAAISERLQQSRKAAGITQEEMADIMGVHVNSVQNWESLRLSTVPFDRLEEWAAVTGTTKVWLLQGEDAPSRPDEAVAIRLEGLEELVREILRRLDPPANSSA